MSRDNDAAASPAEALSGSSTILPSHATILVEGARSSDSAFVSAKSDLQDLPPSSICRLVPWSEILKSPEIASCSPSLKDVGSSTAKATTTIGVSLSPAASVPVNTTVASAPTTSTTVASGSNNSRPASPNLVATAITPLTFGYGVQRAVDRERRLGRLGRRAASILHDIAVLEENFAQGLLKAGQQHWNVSNQQLNHQSTHSSLLHSSRYHLSLQESILSWSSEVTKCSTTVRTTVGLPLQAIHISVTETVAGLTDRMQQARNKSMMVRAQAIKTRAKYAKAVHEAEQCVLEWKLESNLNCSGGAPLNSTNNSTAAERNPLATADVSSSSSCSDIAAMNASSSSSNATATATTASMNMPNKRIITKLKTVQRRVARYKRSVEAENTVVKQCQYLERMALETLQKLEEDRVVAVNHALVAALQAQQEALREIDVGLKEQPATNVASVNTSSIAKPTQDSLPTATAPLSTENGGQEKRGNPRNAFSKRIMLKSQSNPTHSSFSELDEQTQSPSGVMDAETLGLNEDVGKLRDQVRFQVALRSSRVQATKALATFLASLTATAAKFGTSLAKRVGNNGGAGTANGKSSNPTMNASLAVRTNSDGSSNLSLASLLEEMKALENDPTYELWFALFQSVQQEADDSLALASKLRAISAEKLDRLAFYGERLVKAAADQDDLLWKALSEAARNQAKAEDKYRQATEQTAKVRERVRSLDNSDLNKGEQQHPVLNTKHNPLNPGPYSPHRNVGKHVTKGLANMFSILPDGGEQAMKIFAPGARAHISARTLEDAGEKESKGRQILESAVNATCTALSNYRSNAESLLSAYAQEEKTGWEDIQSAVESLVQAIEDTRIPRLAFLSTVDLEHNTTKWMESINDWATTLQQVITSSLQVTSNASIDGNEAGFQLAVQLEPSCSIDSLISAFPEISGNKEADANEDDDADADDEDAEAEDDPGEEINNSTENAEGRSASPSNTPTAVNKDETSAGAASSSSAQALSANAWIRRPWNNAAMAEFRGKLNLRKKLPSAQRNFDGVNMETGIFVSFFWPDTIDPQSIPAFNESFASSFRDENQRLPSQYGRIFISDVRLVFVSWTGKKLNLRWIDIDSFKLVQSAIKSEEHAIMVTAVEKKESSKSDSWYLESFFDCGMVFAMMEQVRAKAITADVAFASKEIPASMERLEASRTGGMGGIASVVPPDSTIQKMEILLSKEIRSISIQRFYEIIWSEGVGASEKQFYKQWLSNACFDIHLSDWEAKQVVGPWCGETYQQTRFVRFKVKRKTHLYIGPPIANVTQNHYCRVEGNDKCVVAMTIMFEGLPYADCFHVEQRWVARRLGEKDICVEMGVIVDFQKYTFLKKQISAGTIEETKSVAKSFFEHARATCLAAGEGEEIEEEEEQLPMEFGQSSEAQPDNAKWAFIFGIDPLLIGACLAVMAFMYWLSRWMLAVPARSTESAGLSSSYNGMFVNEKIEQLEAEVRLIHAKLDIILNKLTEQRLPAFDQSCAIDDNN